MAIKVTDVPKRLAETLVIDTAADATGSGSGDNVFTGTSKATKFYCWKIDGTLVPTAFFIKVQEATSYTLTNDPSWRFYCPANSQVTYIFPEGQTFGTGISFIATTTSARSANTQDDPGGTVTVTVLGGT